MEIRAFTLKVIVVSIINIPSRWMFGKNAISSFEQNINVPKKIHKISSKSLARLLFCFFLVFKLFCVFKFVCSILFYFCGIHTFICVGIIYIKAPIGVIHIIISGNSVHLGIKTVFTLNKIML